MINERSIDPFTFSRRLRNYLCTDNCEGEQDVINKVFLCVIVLRVQRGVFEAPLKIIQSIAIIIDRKNNRFNG